MAACVKSSLELLRAAGGVDATRRKSLLLTTYLERLLRERQLTSPRVAGAGAGVTSRCGVVLTTPTEPHRRGCQLSLRVVAPASGPSPPPKSKNPFEDDSSIAAIGGIEPQKVVSMRELELLLESKGVVTDAREPDIVRAAPVPLYNSFADVRLFVDRLEESLEELGK
eukprot:2158586-Pleurochrysis_carterae.AAC.2